MSLLRHVRVLVTLGFVMAGCPADTPTVSDGSPSTTEDTGTTGPTPTDTPTTERPSSAWGEMTWGESAWGDPD